jgi:hypothetical protein
VFLSLLNREVRENSSFKQQESTQSETGWQTEGKVLPEPAAVQQLAAPSRAENPEKEWYFETVNDREFRKRIEFSDITG